MTITTSICSSISDPHKNSQTVKQGAAFKSLGEKVVKSKVMAAMMLVLINLQPY